MKGYPKSHITSALIAGVCLLLALSAVPAKNDSDVTQIPISLSIDTNSLEAELTSRTTTPATQPISAQTEALDWQAFKVTTGDSLSSIFNRAGLSPRVLHEIISLGPKTSVLAKILPGQTIYVQIDSDGQLQKLRYEPGPLEKLMVTRQKDHFVAAWDHPKADLIHAYKTAEITADNPSLYHAGKKAGISDNMIMKLANIFQWDISFALDLRKGDSFTVLYEDYYVDGEKVKEGEILAASFNNFGKTYTAVRYENSQGATNYYTPDGRSLRKAFLRDPVHFKYVSSSFNLKRLHPIHKKVMPHRGIDYAAKVARRYLPPVTARSR